METRRYIVKKHRTSVPDLSISPGFFSSTFRVVETALFVGGPVYVRGSFKTLKDQVPYVIEPQYLHFLAELANLKRVPGKRNRLFDLDRNGRVCEYELHFGSKMLLSRAKRKVQKDEKPEKVLIQGTLQNDSVHGLMIGDCHQDQLTHRLGALNFLRIIGGAAAIAGGVSLLIFG